MLIYQRVTTEHYKQLSVMPWHNMWGALAHRDRNNWYHKMLCHGITLAHRDRNNWLQVAAWCWLTATVTTGIIRCYAVA
jgi:hypothetical protein